MFFTDLYMKFCKMLEYITYPSKYYSKKYAKKYVNEYINSQKISIDNI